MAEISTNTLANINEYITINTNSYDIMFPILNLNYMENVSKTAKINWKVPKPSANLLFAMLYQAGQISNKYQSEVQFFILYNEDADRCEIFHPKQTISGATVSDWTYDEIPQGKRLLVDVHSHHTMGVDFSSTDDESDKNLSLFCPHISIVLRSINNIDIRNIGNNISCRATYNDGTNFFCKKLNYEDIFDFNPFKLDMENLSFIEKKSMKTDMIFRMNRTADYWNDIPVSEDIYEEYMRGYIAEPEKKRTIKKTKKKKKSLKEHFLLVDPEEAKHEESMVNVGV